VTPEREQQIADAVRRWRPDRDHIFDSNPRAMLLDLWAAYSHLLDELAAEKPSEWARDWDRIRP
jgi:hypothetical protein